MWKYLLLTNLVLFLSTETVTASDVLHPGSPADAGMSTEKLREGVNLFSEAVQKDELRGAVLLVARNGKIVLHESVGWRNKEAKLPMRKDSLFRMASNTKAVIATAVMMLAEEGKLAPEDLLGRHIPAFDNEKCGEIQIRHLLSHTSGFRIKTLFLKPMTAHSARYPDFPNLRLEVSRFATVGPKHQPGTTYSYNNPGYNTLGALVEVKSGQLLENFLTERIYQPLGMKETTNHPVPEKFDRMCVVYEKEKDEKDKKTGKWKIRFRQSSGMRSPFVRGSGGMVSTAVDYARFCQMFLNRGRYDGKRFLSPKSVRLMTSPLTKSLYSQQDADKRTSFYGFGWFVRQDGVFSHGGSEGTFAWIDPGRKLVGLILTQSPDGKIPREAFIETMNAACMDSL